MAHKSSVITARIKPHHFANEGKVLNLQNPLQPNDGFIDRVDSELLPLLFPKVMKNYVIYNLSGN